MGQPTGNDLVKVIEALMAQGHRAKSLAGASKMAEPEVTIRLSRNGTWGLDFYSYCLDLGDHVRHHEAYSSDFDIFIGYLWKMVKMAEFENDATERDGS